MSERNVSDHFSWIELRLFFQFVLEQNIGILEMKFKNMPQSMVVPWFVRTVVMAFIGKFSSTHMQLCVRISMISGCFTAPPIFLIMPVNTRMIPFFSMDFSLLENKAIGIMKPGHAFTIEPMINAGKRNDE